MPDIAKLFRNGRSQAVIPRLVDRNRSTSASSAGARIRSLGYPRFAAGARSRLPTLDESYSSRFGIRLPAAYRFEGDEVYVRRAPETGDVILLPKPTDWNGVFAALDEAEIPEDFLAPAERADRLTEDWRR